MVSPLILARCFCSKTYIAGVSDKHKLCRKILDLLQNPDLKLDKSHALVVCNMHSFSEGILYIYEEQKLYRQILR